MKKPAQAVAHAGFYSTFATDIAALPNRGVGRSASDHASTPALTVS
jgi:hypothetical protein